MKIRWQYFMGAILLISLLIAIGCKSVQPQISVKPVTASTVIDISGIKTVPIKQDVQTGDMVWNVANVKDLGVSLNFDSGYNFQATQGKFISLEFSISNVGTSTEVLFDLRVIDNLGRVFTLCLPAYQYFAPQQSCAVEEIIPGAKQNFVAPFDVATDSTGLILEVTDLKTPPVEMKYIDLGF